MTKYNYSFIILTGNKQPAFTFTKLHIEQLVKIMQAESIEELQAIYPGLKEEDFHEGLASVISKDQGWLHIYPDGTPAYKERYDYAGDFHEGLAEVYSDQGCFHIHLDGTPAYKERYESVSSFSNNLSLVEKNGKFFLIYFDGTPVFRERYYTINDMFTAIGCGVYPNIMIGRKLKPGEKFPEPPKGFLIEKLEAFKKYVRGLRT